MNLAIPGVVKNSFSITLQYYNNGEVMKLAIPAVVKNSFSITLQYYNNGEVMKLAIPAAVKFLNRENGDLGRNVSSYLSLAAIDNADLLVKHIPLLVTSILKGESSR